MGCTIFKGLTKNVKYIWHNLRCCRNRCNWGPIFKHQSGFRVLKHCQRHNGPKVWVLPTTILETYCLSSPLLDLYKSNNKTFVQFFICEIPVTQCERLILTIVAALVLLQHLNWAGHEKLCQVWDLGIEKPNIKGCMTARVSSVILEIRHCNV